VALKIGKLTIQDLPAPPPAVGIGDIKSGDDLREWLRANMIGQNKAAELCGVPPRTFRRWLAGQPPIPKGSLELLFAKISGEIGRDA